MRAIRLGRAGDQRGVRRSLPASVGLPQPCEGLNPSAQYQRKQEGPPTPGSRYLRAADRVRRAAGALVRGARDGGFVRPAACQALGGPGEHRDVGSGEHEVGPRVEVAARDSGSKALTPTALPADRTWPKTRRTAATTSGCDCCPMSPIGAARSLGLTNTSSTAAISPARSTASMVSIRTKRLV